MQIHLEIIFLHKKQKQIQHNFVFFMRVSVTGHDDRMPYDIRILQKGYNYVLTGESYM